MAPRITQSKEWFERKYLNDHLNCQQIGDLLGYSRQAIWKRLRTFGIPIRSKKDAIFFDNGNQCKLSQGYFWIYNPDHPRANYKYVKQSVLVLEKKLGRPLVDGEFPHHKDNDRLNDNHDNLDVTNRSLHMSQHSPINERWKKQRKYLAERKRQAIRLWNQGWTTTGIREHMHLGAGTLNRYLAEVENPPSNLRRREKR